MLADVDAGELRGNGAERAANLARRVGLGIPHINLARPAGEPEEDNTGLALRLASGGGERPLLQQGRQGKAGKALQAGLEKPTAGAADTEQVRARRAEPRQDATAGMGYAVSDRIHCARMRG